MQNKLFRKKAGKEPTQGAAGNALIQTRVRRYVGLSYRLMCLCAACHGARVMANPQGLSVASGSAKAVATGNTLTITTSQNAALNWSSFNIAKGQTTTFVQPNSYSVVFNQINDTSASQIYGSLTANGRVILVNSSGFYFGPDSFVKTAGFVATTGQYVPDFSGGSSWEFSGPAPMAKVVNYGKIEVDSGGSLFLMAANVENHGTLSAPKGTIGLLSGQDVVLGDRPDGTGINVSVKLPAGSVNNDGRIIADAGTIIANARVVNQNGLVQANSVREVNGVIEFFASDSVNLGAQSSIHADGDASSVTASKGGTVTIKSDGSFSDAQGSVVSATGGVSGGNGGSIEISAPSVTSLLSELSAAANPGYQSGIFNLDPTTINISSSQTPSGTLSGSGSTGTVSSGSSPTTLALNIGSPTIASSFKNFSTINLQATGTINLLSGTAWDLAKSTGQSTGNLTLTSGGNINFQNNASISDSQGWSVNLIAGCANFTTLALKPSSSASGSIFLNSANNGSGNGFINLSGGSLSLQAAVDIQASTGSLTASQGVLAGAGANLKLGSGNVSSSGGDVQLSAGNGGVSGNITGSGSVTSSGGVVSMTSNNGSITTGGNITDSSGKNITLSSKSDINVTGKVQADNGGNINLTSTQGNVSVGQVENAAGKISLNALGGSLNLGVGGLDDASGLNDKSLDAVTLSAKTGINAIGAIGVENGGNVTLTTASGGTGGASLFSVTTDSGNINIHTSGDIVIGQTGGNGWAKTTAGGSISMISDAGMIDARSTYAGGFDYASSGGQYTLISNPGDLGAISTGAGGNIYLKASKDVDVFDPTTVLSGAVDPGIGAYGGGNVTVISTGGNVNGHYLVANGQGTISTANTFEGSLSLIKGSWTVDGNVTGANPSAMAQSIVLNEVRNPNGIFNNRSTSDFNYHLFNYDDSASVTLKGNSVELVDSGLRNASDKIPAIYPPSLTIDAGNGGIKLDNDLILFPSAKGALDIEDAGSLIPSGSSTVNFVMSDSAQKQYLSTGNFGPGDHGGAPVHLYDASGNPVAETTCTINVGGDMNNIALSLPEAAKINVTGNVKNSSFYIQNLHPTDLSTFAVGGNILNSSQYNSVVLSSLTYVPDLTLLNLTANQAGLVPDYSGLFNNLAYFPATKTLVMKGPMSADQLLALTQLKVPALNSDGAPILDSQGLPSTKTVSIFNPSDSAVTGLLGQLRLESESAPTSKAAGYTVAGPGGLSVSANSIDLGDTFGIQSVGPYVNPNLALHLYQNNDPEQVGSAVTVHSKGDINMFDSQISTVAGGDVTVISGGTITAGSTLVPATDHSARGIFSVAKGNVTVLAYKDILLAGSRAAAFDGGSVYVASLDGNIDAGNGSSGSIAFSEVILNPILDPKTGLALTDPLDKTGKTKEYSVFVPLVSLGANGIFAGTFPVSAGDNSGLTPSHVGSITVEALNGNIIASQSGIKQLSLNGTSVTDSGNPSTPAPKVTVVAGIQGLVDQGKNGATDPGKAIDSTLPVVNSTESSPNLQAAIKSVLGTSTVPAFTTKATGTVGNIEATGAGILGGNVSLDAAGGVSGFVFALGNLNLSTVQNVDVNAVAIGTVTVSSTSGSVAGSLVGVGGISASGSSISATFTTQGSASGNGASVERNTGTANVAAASSAAASADDKGKQTAVASNDTENDESKKRKLPVITKTGRVTVILPKKT